MTQNVICIDESGNFESREEHARFLGGCIYKGDSVWEEKALTRMFEKLAEDITEKYGELLHGNRFSYPASFHMSQLTVFDEAMTAQVIDDDDVRRQIKKMILERVKTYLKEKKKDYQMFALVVPFQNHVGYEDSHNTRECNLTDFRTPGVLYERLITGLVHNFTFYFLDDVDKNSFKIASRTPVIRQEEVTRELLDQICKTNTVHKNNRKLYLNATSLNTFRASLAEKMFEKNPVNRLSVKEVELDCRSIDYSGENKKEISPFYYFSDVVCSYLLKLFYGETNQNYHDFKVTSSELERVRKECVVPVFFWAYEETDQCFKQAVEAYAADRIAECFSHLYDMHHTGGECCEYYRNFWEKRLWKRIEQSHIRQKNEKFQLQISEELMYIERFSHNRADYARMEFILNALERILTDGKYTLKAKDDYHLQDLLLRVYNHHGSVEKSRMYFRKLLKVSGAVDMETFAGSVNRAAQIYFNQFDYQPLIEIYDFLLEEARNLKDTQLGHKKQMEQILEMYFGESESAEEGCERYDWMAKMYSSMGQAYAFGEKYEEAVECFEQAIHEFAPEDSANRIRTRGYQLHAWICVGEKESYLKHCREIFGSERLSEQASSLIRTGLNSSSVRYNLFLWMKAVYCLQLYENREEKDAVKKIIKEIRRLYEKDAEALEMHPWEFIFKYAYLLCRENPELNEDTALFRELCLKQWQLDEETLLVIKLFTAYEYEEDAGKRKEIMNQLEKISEKLNGIKELRKAQNKEEYLRHKLTYTYF